PNGAIWQIGSGGFSEADFDAGEGEAYTAIASAGGTTVVAGQRTSQPKTGARDGVLRRVPATRLATLAAPARVAFERQAIAITDLRAPLVLDLVRDPSSLDQIAEIEVVIELITRRGAEVT